MPKRPLSSPDLLGPIGSTAALLPQLKQQPNSAIVNVSSGLAFVPLAFTDLYCATKSAIHSYTQSLRFQLRSTSVEVLELIPPYVQTHLMDGADDPRAMPLGQFIAEVMEILKSEPTLKEICVQNVNGLRLAAEQGRYDGTLTASTQPWRKDLFDRCKRVLLCVSEVQCDIAFGRRNARLSRSVL